MTIIITKSKKSFKCLTFLQAVKRLNQKTIHSFCIDELYTIPSSQGRFETEMDAKQFIKDLEKEGLIQIEYSFLERYLKKQDTI